MSTVNQVNQPGIAKNTNYDFDVYADNWSYWNPKHREQYPNISKNLHGVVAFGVVKSDGSFDDRYPLGPAKDKWTQGAPPGCDGLAIGGWNNSQANAGLNEVLTRQDPKARITLITNIIKNAKEYGYKRVVIDYENYIKPPPDKALYTNFLKELKQQLHAQNPPIQLEIAMSPDPANQQFYDLKKLISSGTVDHFQVMCYDYARGQGSPVKVDANAGVSDTLQFLENLFQDNPGLESKAKIGIPLYGLEYDLPVGITPEQVASELKAGTLTGSYDTGPTQSVIKDDDISTEIGNNWATPANGWKLLEDGSTPPNYFYYNHKQNKIISALPPQAEKNFADMIKKNFPHVVGFFGWEAQGDFNGSMMENLINNFS